MSAFLQGGVLSRRFYEEAVRPLLAEYFAGIPYAASSQNRERDVRHVDLREPVKAERAEALSLHVLCECFSSNLLLDPGSRGVGGVTQRQIGGVDQTLTPGVESQARAHSVHEQALLCEHRFRNYTTYYWLHALQIA